MQTLGNGEAVKEPLEGAATDAAAAEGDAAETPRLNPDDQARVDGFLSRGVNSVERKPFRPLILLLVLIAVVGGLSLISQWLANQAGVG